MKDEYDKKLFAEKIKIGKIEAEIRRRKKEDDKIKAELEWGDSRTNFDEVKDEMFRRGTRLDQTRILQTDEDA